QVLVQLGPRGVAVPFEDARQGKEKIGVEVLPAEAVLEEETVRRVEVPALGFGEDGRNGRGAHAEEVEHRGDDTWIDGDRALQPVLQERTLGADGQVTVGRVEGRAEAGGGL